jgi:hypothetical protein
MSTTTRDFLRHLRTMATRQAIDGLSDHQLLTRGIAVESGKTEDLGDLKSKLADE